MGADTTTPSTTAPALAGRREWLGLTVLVLPALIIGMDLTVLHLAVPTIAEDLHPSASQLLWVMDVYGFVIAGLLVPMGKLADRIGRRKLLLIGAVCFGVASVVAAYAPNTGVLIAARAMLGIAGATVSPSTLSLIRSMFTDDGQRTKAISVWSIATLAGNAIGPLIGGALLESFWWGSAFLLAVPVMVLLLVAGPILLPEYRDPRPGKVDLTSAALAVASVLGVIYGIQRIAEAGVGWVPVATIVAGVLIGVAFVWRQGRIDDPMLDLHLLKDRGFTVSLGTLVFGSLMLTGTGYFGMQFMQLVLGLSTMQASLWLLPMLLSAVVATMFTPKLVGKIAPSTVVAGGMAVAAVGFAVLTQLGGLPVLLAGYVVIFVGLAPVTMLAVGMMVGAAPPDRAGAASALSETSQQFGGALGLAVFGSIGTAVYHSTLSETLPAGIPASAAAEAESTLGGAVAAAGRLPAELGNGLLDAAKAAFTDGVQVTTLITAVAAVIVAVAVALLLRRKNTGDAPAAAEETAEVTTAVD